MFAIIALLVPKECCDSRHTQQTILCFNFTLMQNSLYELKDKLVQALDNQNNVVDMAQVIEVIEILERTIITKDDLEKTRLGKYINELRKKTFNETLAKRAKKLVKSWRKLMERTADNSIISPLNGERVSPGSTRLSPGLRLLSARSLQPTSLSLLPQNGKSSVSPASMSTTSSSRLIASPTDYCSASNSPMLPPSHSSYAPLASRAYNKPVSPVDAHSTYDISKTNAANKRPRKDIIQNTKFNFNGIFESIQAHELKRSEGSVASLSPVVSPVVNDCTISEDNKIVKQRGRKKKKKEITIDPLKDKFNAALRIHKLQTTQELAQKFNIEIASHEVKDQTLNERIASSFSAKNFAKNSSEVDDETKTKSELMHRFLSSTTSPTNEEEEQQKNDNNYHSFHSTRDSDYAMPAISHSVHSSEHPLPSTSLSHNVVSDSIGDEIKDILSQLPPINVNDIVWSDSELNDNNSKDSNHINIDNNIDNSNNHNNRDNNEDQSIAMSEDLDKDEVSEAHVSKLLEDKWEYVNGTYDCETEWKEWHQMTSAVSFSGDILHILPYVNYD